MIEESTRENADDDAAAYVAPELSVVGSVGELTLGASGATSDGEGTVGTPSFPT